MRRRVLISAIGAVLMGGLAWADPQPNLFVTTSATTQPDWKIVITATIENRGQASSEEGKQLEVTFKPQMSRSNRGNSKEPTMADPFVEVQPIPAIEPGQKVDLTFSTQYLSKSQFKNVRGTFKASNVDPTGSDVNVQVHTKIK